MTSTSSRTAPTAPNQRDEPDDTPVDSASVVIIAAPAHWPAAEQREFTRLPPAIQAIMVRRERERDIPLAARHDGAAEAVQKHQQQRLQLVSVARQRLDGHIRQLATALKQTRDGIDWQRLARHNPAAHAQLQARSAAAHARLAKMVQQRRQLAVVQQRHHAAVEQARAAQLHHQLRRADPVFGHPGQARAELDRIRDYAQRQGLAGHPALRQPGAILALRKAMALDALPAARKTGGKPVRRAEKSAKAAPAPDRARRLAGLKAQLASSGSVADAARLFEGMME